MYAVVVVVGFSASYFRRSRLRDIIIGNWKELLFSNLNSEISCLYYRKGIFFPMNLKRVLLILYITVILFFKGYAYDNKTDSLAYILKREEIVEAGDTLGEYQAYLDAADALAQKGYWLEAYDLLFELFEYEEEQTTEDFADIYTEMHKAESMKLSTDMHQEDIQVEIGKQEYKKTTWNIQTGIQYYRFDEDYFKTIEDETDTVFGTIDSMQYSTDDEPVTGSIKLSCIQYNPEMIINSISPFAYLSNERARGGLSMSGDAMEGIFSFALDIESEKKLREEYGDSSNVARGDLSLEFSTKPKERIFRFSFPISVEADKYRIERSGYYSSVEGSGAPGIGFQSRDFSLFGELVWEAEYQRYYAINNEDDHISTGPRLSFNLYKKSSSSNMDISLCREWYPNSEDPRIHDRFTFAGNSSVIPLNWLECEIGLDIYREIETYINQDEILLTPSSDSIIDSTVSYKIKPWGIRARPLLRFNLPGDFSLFTEFEYDRNIYPEINYIGSYKLIESVTIFESSQVYSSRLGYDLSKDKFHYEISISYTYRDIINRLYTQDSDEIRPMLEFYCTLFSRLTLDGSFDYQYRWYRSSEMEDEHNISAYFTTGIMF